MNKVVASAIIRNNLGQILAVRLNKEVTGGVWVPPGGKLHEDETLRECVIREVREELGIEITVDKLSGVSEEKYADGYWTFVFFESRITSGTLEIREPEKIIEFSYIDPHQLKNHDLIHWLN